MNELRNTDALLKRYLKGKFSLTKAVVVSFLITGAVSFAGSNGPVSSIARKYQYSYTAPTLVSPTLTSTGTTETVPSTLGVPTVPTTLISAPTTGANSHNVATEVNPTGTFASGLWVYGTPTANKVASNANAIANSSAVNYGISLLGGTAAASTVVAGADGFTYTNTGAVTATTAVTGKTNYGIYVGGGTAAGAITLDNSGAVASTGYGLAAVAGTVDTADVTINNTGAVTGDVIAVAGTVANADAVVDNKAGGTIADGMFAYGSIGTTAHAGNATVINSGTVTGGMYAIKGAGTGTIVADNSGTVDNMYAVGGTETGAVEATNSGTVTGSMIAQAGKAGNALAINEDGGIVNGDMIAIGGNTGYAYVRNDGTLKGESTIVATGENAYGDNSGLIVTDGDYGMVASAAAVVWNDGNIVNTGNYGMVATGPGTEAWNYGNINNGSIISETGNYGMAALDGGYAVNRSVVNNTADYGMIASGIYNPNASGAVPSIVSNGNNYIYTDNEQSNTSYYEGYITNGGDYGMAALAGAIALNREEGIVENHGDVGMLASGAVSSNQVYSLELSSTETVDLDLGSSYAINFGTIQNNGDYGMMAVDGGVIVNDDGGLIQNKGDVGMYIDSTSVGYNGGWAADGRSAGIFNQGNVGVFTDGYFINQGLIAPQNLNGESHLAAVVSGTSNGTVLFSNDLDSGVYNPTPNNGGLINTGGTDVLQFGADVTDGASVLNSNSLFYNYIFGSGIAHNEVDLTAKTVDYDATPNTWTLNGKHYLLGGAPLADADAYLDTANNTTADVLDTDIVLGTDARVRFVIGRDKLTKSQDYFVSPTVYANSYNPTAGVHDNLALDRTFITDANEVVINVAQVDTSVGNWAVPGTGVATYTLDQAEANGITTSTVSDVVGWTAHYELDADGNLDLVYTKDTGLLGNGSTRYTAQNKAPGGYGDANSYPHSNLDTVNARHIIDRGYLYARKAAFMRPEVTEETVTYPAPVADKPGKSVPVVTEKGKEVVQPPVIEEVVKTYKNYENLQFAEVFGDWGSYSGSGAKYDFDTVGVTGATFHKFHDYPEWMAGLAYGYAHSKVDYENHKGSKEKLNTLGIDAFLSWTRENWLVTGEFGYSWSKHDLKRRFSDYDAEYLVGSVLDRQASKKFDSHQWNLGFEVGYNYIVDPTFSLYPYAGFDYIWNSRDSYTENSDGWSGNEAFSGTMTLDKYTVDVDKNKYDTGVFKLGIMGEKLYERWTFTGDVAWKYYTNDYKALSGSYVDASERGENVYFKSHNLDMGNSLAYVHVGVDYAVTPQLNVGLEYTGYYRSKQSGSLFGGNLTYKF